MAGAQQPLGDVGVRGAGDKRQPHPDRVSHRLPRQLIQNRVRQRIERRTMIKHNHLTRTESDAAGEQEFAKQGSGQTEPSDIRVQQPTTVAVLMGHSEHVIGQ